MAVRLSVVLVVVAARSEGIEDDGGLERPGLMLDATTDDEGVAGTQLERLAAARHAQAPGDQVHGLVVRMAVAGACPTLLHAMLDQHEPRVVREHAAREPRLRLRWVGVLPQPKRDVGFLLP